MENYFNEMTNKYPVVKVLRFALKPVGNTRETIRKNLVLEQGMEITSNLENVKTLIAGIHKFLIDDVLKSTVLSVDLLREIYELSAASGSGERYEEIQQLLRKELSKSFTQHPLFEKLDGKELFSDVLPKFAITEEDLSAIASFEGRTTLLDNYNKKKKKMYSDEKKHLRLPYRLVNENLPRFMENIQVFRLLNERNACSFEDMTELKSLLGVTDFSAFFEPEGFNLVLTQAGIDTYNQLIGGVATENSKIKGLNEYINLYNQQHPKERKIPLCTRLYKQILSVGNTGSFIIRAYSTDEEVLNELTVSTDKLMTQILGRTDGMSYRELFWEIDTFNLDGVFVKAADINEISFRYCGRWRELDDVFSKRYDAAYTGKKKPGTEKYEEEKRKELGKIKGRSLVEIRDAFCERTGRNFTDWIKNEAVTLEGDAKHKAGVMLKMIGTHGKETPIRQHTQLVSAIKDYLDAVKELQWFLALFAGNGNAERDMLFYAEHNALTDLFVPFTALYNMVQNYITKKPFSDEKTLLTFNRPTLLSGWSVTKESENAGMILRRDGKLYLGIAGSSDIFNELAEDAGHGTCYEKMEYRLLPDPSKMLPKVCFSQKYLAAFQPSDEILRIRNEGTFKKGAAFSLADCHALIDYYKDCIRKYEAWKTFGFKFSPTEQYQDINGFYREVSDQGYKVTFKNVSTALIDEMVEDGRLYLFQIWSKDFSEYSTGNLDAQTVYLNMLFDERNLSNVVYKLCGGAEVFYRPKSLDVAKTPVHKANVPIANKNPQNEKRCSLFTYDIIKDRRYTEEKFLLHIPVTMNMKATGTAYTLNMDINNAIRNAKDQHIIGITRGERNLLYIVVINSRGEIKEQFSLNTIVNDFCDSNGNKGKLSTDYHELLDKREKQRDAARVNWQEMDDIRNLKKGYLSQVVYVITRLAIKYNALIVMEDLSSVFVNRRKKIEKSIYQEFESALLKKLGYLLIDKNRDLAGVNNPGGALKAYQLAGPVSSVEKRGCRNGIVFYVSPWQVSNMDPATGFTKQISFRYENMLQAKKFISCFDAIRYNKERDYFEFELDYKNFGVKTNGKTEWTVCTYGRRLEHFKNPDKNDMKDTRDYYPTDELKRLFEEYSIDYGSGNSVLEQVLGVIEDAFYKALLHVFTMTLQMYNYAEGLDAGAEEFFQSCVINGSGEFFNSLSAKESQPQRGDAIAAYHIAKKGLLLAERIKASEGGKISMVVKNEEWIEYVQQNLQD